MNYYGRAVGIAQSIVRAFEDANSLPKPLAQIFIRRKDASHFSKWSWGNQLLVILRGFTDARGFQQWRDVGRWVKKGEKAFYILGPIKKKIIDKETSEEKSIVVGFKGVAVFGLEQTDGEPLPIGDPEIETWLDSLPLVDVAKKWGLSVDVFNGETAGFLGVYRRRSGIALGVRNLSTWCHELVHAADDRNGTMKELGQHWRSETVAELGGSVVLEYRNMTWFVSSSIPRSGRSVSWPLVRMTWASCNPCESLSQMSKRGTPSARASFQRI